MQRQQPRREPTAGQRKGFVAFFHASSVYIVCMSTTGRREPPPFRRAELLSTEMLGPQLMRIELVGDELSQMVIEEPAASVRLLLPRPGKDLEIPVWQGNEFLDADGSRPIIRTFTPRYHQDDRLTIDIVIHDGGAASEWARSASPGSPVAVSGPGRGYAIDQTAERFLLLGDETAVPAIAQLLESLPGVPVDVDLVVPQGFGKVGLPAHDRVDARWHELGGDRGASMLSALSTRERLSESVIWCAGQAAAVHAVRNYLFKELGLPRSQATVRGYWKS